MSVALSNTELTKVSTEAAETFVDAYYSALDSARGTLKDFYIPASNAGRPLPHISYNGDLNNDAVLFQQKFESMPFTYHEAQSVNCMVLNTCLDPTASKNEREARHNLSLAVQVSGYVRLHERKDGPMHGFSDNLVLVPNKQDVGGKGRGKTGEGRSWVIQTQNFRLVT